MNQSHIHLLGVIGFDPEGNARLRKALERERPDVITADVSEKFVEYFDGEWLQDQLEKLSSYDGLKPEVKVFIEQQIRDIYRYPVTIPREYAEERHIPIYFIGDNADVECVKKAIKGPNTSTSEEINRNEIRDKKIQYAESKYRAFQGWFSNPDFASQFMMNDYVQKFLQDDPARSKVIAKNLTRLAYQVTGKIVHVSEVDVLTDDLRGQSLYERIRNLNPTRGTIADY